MDPVMDPVIGQGGPHPPLGGPEAPAGLRASRGPRVGPRVRGAGVRLAPRWHTELWRGPATVPGCLLGSAPHGLPWHVQSGTYLS